MRAIGPVSSSLRHWVALGALVFVGNAMLRPAVAQTPAPGTAAPTPAPGYATHPQDPPHQPQLVHQRRPGLIVGGAIVFGLSWVPAVALSAAMFADGCCPRTAGGLWIPVLGPVMAMPAHDRGVGILWSAAQLAGVVMFGYGMAGHDVAAVSAARPGVALHLVPMLARGAGGMTLAARW